MEEKLDRPAVPEMVGKTDADIILFLFQEYKMAVQDKEFWKEQAEQLSEMLTQIRNMIEKEQIKMANSGIYSMEQIANPLIDADNLKPILQMDYLCKAATEILQEKEDESD